VARSKLAARRVVTCCNWRS